MLPTPALGKFNEEMRKRYGITPEQSHAQRERLRSLARHNEASAIHEAEERGREGEREKWQGVVDDKDAEIEKLRLQLAELQAKTGS
jgi:hypothetical protein